MRRGATSTAGPTGAAARAAARARDHLLLLAGACGISTAPILFALADVDPTPAAFWRFAYALPAIALVCSVRPAARASFRARGWRALAALAGLCFAADILCWHRSVVLIGAGPSTLLANTQVIWVALFGLLALRERPSGVFWAGLPLLFGGLWLLAGGAAGVPGAVDLRGLGLGLAAGILYAGALICVRRAQRVAPPAPEAVLAVQLAVALVVASVAGLAEGSLPVSLSAAQHGWLLLLALGVQCAAWFLITRQLKRLPGHHGAILLLAQPLGSTLLGWLILEQALEVERLLGAGLLLAAIVAAIVAESRRPQREPASRA